VLAATTTGAATAMLACRRCHHKRQPSSHKRIPRTARQLAGGRDVERTDWLDEGFDSAQAQFLMVTAITHHRVSSPLWGEDEVRKLQAEIAEIASAAAQIATPGPSAELRAGRDFLRTSTSNRL
jgi:hypothetical protein